MKKALLFFSVCALLIAQTGQPVRISDDPSPVGIQSVFGYSGSNLIYVCNSPGFANSGIRTTPSSLASATATQASPTVIAVTHQFALKTRPTITITGVTGTGYTGASGINLTWIGTVVDSTHISVPFDSSALGAATWTAASFTTTAPRLNLPEWAVQILGYDASNNLILKAWLGSSANTPTTGGGTGYNAKCSDAAGTTVGVQ